MYCIVTGMEFASTREMEEAYGIDSVEMLEAEARANHEEWLHQHTMYPWFNQAPVYDNDEIPF